MSTPVVDAEAADAVLTPAELPTAVSVRGLLNGLFDKPVAVVEEKTAVLPGRGVKVVGSYVDPEQVVRGVAFVDLSLGAALGAALALVPVPRYHDAITAGEVPEDLGDNTREVLNIAASLFNHGDTHLKLRDFWVAPQPVGDDAVAFLRTSPRRQDFTVEVPGYGSGVLVLLIT